jgi:hypothetical protein
MYHFHVNLFAAPPAESFAVTWEDAAATLHQLPRMIFEPDGSFVVTGARAEPPPASRVVPDPGQSSTPWQVDGHLFDFAGRLHRVELRGECPQDVFDELLRCVGWPAQPLVFEMMREGVTLDEREFRERAGASPPPVSNAT